MTATTVPLHKLIGLEVTVPTDLGLGIPAIIRDAKTAYGRVRILVEGPEANGKGTATTWVELDRCTVKTANGLVTGTKALNLAAV